MSALDDIERACSRINQIDQESTLPGGSGGSPYLAGQGNVARMVLADLCAARRELDAVRTERDAQCSARLVEDRLKMDALVALDEANDRAAAQTRRLEAFAHWNDAAGWRMHDVTEDEWRRACEAADHPALITKSGNEAMLDALNDVLGERGV